jgi:hypothetical protein
MVNVIPFGARHDSGRRAPVMCPMSATAASAPRWAACTAEPISIEKTQRTLDRYLGRMGADDDFGECFTADVAPEGSSTATWFRHSIR